MRRYILSIISAVLLIVIMAIPAFASVGDGDGDDFGFWDIIDAIGGFFGDISYAIGGVIESVGVFIDNIINSIWGAFKWLLDGLKRLFIPRDNYFPGVIKELRESFTKKFGGILGMVSYFRERINDIKPYRGFDTAFLLNFPRNHLLNGVVFNLYDSGLEIITMIRSAFSGLLMIMTFAFCYRRIISLVNS